MLTHEVSQINEPAAVLYVGHRLFLGQAADRGTMTIRVEVWGFLARGTVAVSDHLGWDAA